MTLKETITEFISHPVIAVAGVSRNKRKFGSIIYHHMLKHGYTVYPINPNIKEYEGAPCYANVNSLPEDAQVVVTVTPPDATLQIVQDAATRGITMIWMQPGSTSKEAVALAESHGIKVVNAKCIMMFAEPVKSIHRLHRSINKLFGQYPG